MYKIKIMYRKEVATPQQRVCWLSYSILYNSYISR